MIHIYTGNGKGKTTAAVGQVIRALGRGWNIAWIQYCKDVLKNPSGEILILRKLKIPLYHYAPKIPLFNSRVKLSDIKKDCLKSLNVLKQLFNGRYYDLIVLDELNVAIAKGFLPLSKILLLLQKKPSTVEVIITGRGKHKRLVQIADLVTEMKEIKHPFKRGVRARKGIEY